MGHPPRPFFIRLISDTHGLVVSGVSSAFAAVELVLRSGHAGGRELDIVELSDEAR